MGVALIGIEIVALCLLWQATLIHFRTTLDSWSGRLLIVCASALPPAVLLGLIVHIAYLSHFVAQPGLALPMWSGSMLLVQITGAAILWRRGHVAISHRGFGVVLVTATSLLALVLCLTLRNADRAATERVAAIRRSAMTEFLHFVAPLRDGEPKAAGVYANAFAHLEKDKVSSKEQAIEDAWPKSKAALEARLVLEESEVIDLLRRAAAIPGCRWDHDWAKTGVETTLPELNFLRESARLLEIDARQATDAGHVEQAMSDVAAMFGLARHADEDPFCVSHLVANGIRWKASQSLAAILPAVTREGQLDQIHIDSLAASRASFTRAIRAEGDLGQTSIADYVNLKLSEQTRECEFGNAFWPARRRAIPAGLMSSYRVLYLWKDLEGYQSLVGQSERIISSPEPMVHNLALLDDLMASREKFGTFAAGPFNCNKRLAVMELRNQALLTATATALAITRYRLEHHSIPALSSLIPSYLPAYPIDPLTDEPVRLGIDASGVTVYCAGRDCLYHGGVLCDDFHPSGDTGLHINFSEHPD